jgi:seryl-tRNA(Sec) selenium transferase
MYVNIPFGAKMIGGGFTGVLVGKKEVITSFGGLKQL